MTNTPDPGGSDDGSGASASERWAEYVRLKAACTKSAFAETGSGRPSEGTEFVALKANYDLLRTGALYVLEELIHGYNNRLKNPDGGRQETAELGSLMFFVGAIYATDRLRFRKQFIGEVHGAVTEKLWKTLLFSRATFESYSHFENWVRRSVKNKAIDHGKSEQAKQHAADELGYLTGNLKHDPPEEDIRVNQVCDNVQALWDEGASDERVKDEFNKMV